MRKNQRLWGFLTSEPKDTLIPVSTETLARRFGYVATAGVSADLKKWAADGLIEVVTTRNPRGGRPPITGVRVLSKPATNGHAGPAPAGTKGKLLDYLWRNANGKGYVSVPTQQIRRHFGLSGHDLIKFLFDLKTDGKIAFNVRGTGSDMFVDNIRVRPAAQFKQEPVPEPTERPQEAVEAPTGTETPLAPEPPKEAVPSPYPLIRAALDKMARVEALEQAAEGLIAAGYNDDADALLAREQVSPLEREIARYVGKYSSED